MIHGSIYEDLLGHCRPYQAEAPWSRLHAELGIWELPSDTSSWLEPLREKYTADDLLGSGVVTISRGKRLTPNPFLGKPCCPILPLRHHSQDRPFDLLTQEGTMSRRLSVCAALHDGFLRSQSEKLGALLVAFSMADLVALRLVGIPATMACGLQQLTGDYLVDFCRSFGLGTAGTKACTEQDSMSRAESRPTGIVATGSAATSMDQEPDRVATNPPRSPSLRLVIVNWVPSELRREEPAQQQKVRSHLRDLEKHLQLPLDEVLVWTPAIEDVERVKFCLANSGREQVRAAILDSLDGGLVQATDTEDQFTLPNDLPGIWTALRETSLHGSRNSRLEKQLWDEYERMIHVELVEPLVRQAQQEPDPENRARLLGIAVINRLLHPTAELYSANLTRQVRKTGIRKARLVDGRELLPVTKLLDQLFKLLKMGD